jgi:hypothetical protein
VQAEVRSPEQVVEGAEGASIEPERRVTAQSNLAAEARRRPIPRPLAKASGQA